MSLTAICIEVRRKLQCANVQLTFDTDFSKCQSSVRIVLKPNEITIKHDETSSLISLAPYFTIDQKSISSLVIENNNVSFRVILSNDTGSLELILDDENNENTIVPNDALKVTTNLNETYQLKCANCENSLLNEPKKFTRILELPTEFVGMSEWFCHKQDHLEHDLTPKINDLFFGLYFIVMNLSNFSNLTSRERFIYCKRCLKFLGEKVYNGQALKVWNDSVSVDTDGGRTKQQLFLVQDTKSCIYNIIKKILDESMLTSRLHSIQFAKILFEATFPNRKRNFLMFNVMERNLEILTNFHVNSREIELEERKSFKVLFKVEEDGEQPLINFWKSDFNVQSVTISYKMFTEFVKLLQDNSKLIPEIYRSSNGFCLSFFCY